MWAAWSKGNPLGLPLVVVAVTIIRRAAAPLHALDYFASLVCAAGTGSQRLGNSSPLVTASSFLAIMPLQVSVPGALFVNASQFNCHSG